MVFKIASDLFGHFFMHIFTLQIWAATRRYCRECSSKVFENKKKLPWLFDLFVGLFRREIQYRCWLLLFRNTGVFCFSSFSEPCKSSVNSQCPVGPATCLVYLVQPACSVDPATCLVQPAWPAWPVVDSAACPVHPAWPICPVDPAVFFVHPACLACPVGPVARLVGPAW
jgi:hypothetical protein